MAQETSSVDRPRVGPSYLPVQERLKTWKEFTIAPDEGVERAGRALHRLWHSLLPCDRLPDREPDSRVERAGRER